MSHDDPQPWVTPVQFQAIEAGLRVVTAWTNAGDEDALAHALHRETDAADIVIGLATVTRLLAMELAAATATTETDVLAHLDARVHHLQRTG
ncbi:hypothetical protein [Cellulomonas bogoriensis]|uniref:Uncharacterized protein n=1 Tax=Cellulomonas bogoriensis 69B4 = DSM 16987 TaxID=1386082 RepID=A0A0A0C1W7_9CELL|nr:hypothetical protein [Cellulomonas bogoriensis]KGM13977.1 hypothetical protein N869_06890 [Cellulomonas bogoriensis 69B4 = DSM 16987]